MSTRRPDPQRKRNTMLKAGRSRSTPASRAPTTEVASAPAPLDTRFVRPGPSIEVAFARPVEHGQPQRITGILLGVMYARGAIHHYRVAAQGVVWIVPTVWLTPAARDAARKATAPMSEDADITQRLRGLLAMLRERNREAGA